MSEEQKSKFVTVGEAMEMGERIVAALEEEYSALEAELVESFAGKVPDDVLKLIRVQVHEDLTVGLLKLKRRLSTEGLRQFLESKKAPDDVVADGDEPNPTEDPEQ